MWRVKITVFIRHLELELREREKQFIRQTAIRVGSCGIPRSLPLAEIKHRQHQQPHKINLKSNNRDKDKKTTMKKTKTKTKNDN